MTTIMPFINAYSAIVITAALPIAFILLRKKETINIPEFDKPWPMFTWICGMFVVGMGVGLAIGLPGTISTYLSRGFGTGAAWFLAWNANGPFTWALYAVVGYWYIKHPHNKFGIYSTIFSTVTGMVVTTAVAIINISPMLGIQNVLGVGFLIPVIAVIIALVSAKFNWLQRFSRWNVALFGLLVLFVVSIPFVGLPSILNYNPANVNILHEWFLSNETAFWWAWYILWAPTVGRYMAFISNGKTIRQFFAAAIIIPSIVSLIWTSILFGYGGAIFNPETLSRHDIFSPFWFVVVLAILNGMFFMVTTFDGDCKIFCQDVNYLSKGKLPKEKLVLVYGFLLLLMTALVNTGVFGQGWDGIILFCAVSAVILLPFMAISLISPFKKRIK